MARAKKSVNLFEVVERTNELVIIKVNAKDPLTVARHPYISGDFAYISVYLNNDRRLIIITKDSGKTFSWTNATLVTENLNVLRRKIREFLQNNYIRYY